MAAIFLNDLSANPWVIAEQGVATSKSVRVGSVRYVEPASPAHVVDLSDGHGRPILRLDDANREFRLHGWINGLTVDRLDSGYLVVSLLTD